MADSPAFDWLCDQLEEGTSLDRLEARGTVRIALKSAGLEARTVSPPQMKVVIEKILGEELTARGISDGASLCSRLAGEIDRKAASLTSDAPGETPDAVFSRLGGGA